MIGFGTHWSISKLPENVISASALAETTTYKMTFTVKRENRANIADPVMHKYQPHELF